MIMIMTIANFLVLLDELVVFVAVVVGMQLPIYNWDYTGAWLCSYKLLLYSQQNENVDQEECVVFFHLEDRGFSWFNQFNQFIFGSIDESPASTYRDGHKDVPQALA